MKRRRESRRTRPVCFSGILSEYDSQEKIIVGFLGLFALVFLLNVFSHDSETQNIQTLQKINTCFIPDEFTWLQCGEIFGK